MLSESSGGSTEVAEPTSVAREWEVSATPPGGLPPSFDHPRLVHHHRLAEAEPLQAPRYRVHRGVVDPGVLLVGLDRVRGPQLDLHGRVLPARAPGPLRARFWGRRVRAQGESTGARERGERACQACHPDLTWHRTAWGCLQRHGAARERTGACGGFRRDLTFSDILGRARPRWESRNGLKASPSRTQVGGSERPTGCDDELWGDCPDAESGATTFGAHASDAAEIVCAQRT